MMPAPYPVFAAGASSNQSLSRSLSPRDRLSANSSAATRPRQSLSHCKPLPHLPTGQFSHRIRPSKLQKTIQCPETRSGFVQ